MLSIGTVSSRLWPNRAGIDEFKVLGRSLKLDIVAEEGCCDLERLEVVSHESEMIGVGQIKFAGNNGRFLQVSSGSARIAINIHEIEGVVTNSKGVSRGFTRAPLTWCIYPFEQSQEINKYLSGSLSNDGTNYGRFTDTLRLRRTEELPKFVIKEIVNTIVLE